MIHGGPFANIAHGCNSVLATQTALKLADYVVTEAGFGADLGAEKFIDIKCRKTGLQPSAVVLVATIRALKYHGGIDVKELGKENLEALAKGIANIERHVNNIRNNYGLPCVVAINHRTEDTDAEVQLLQDKMAHHGAKVILARHWAEGGKGAAEVAKEVVRLCEEPNELQVRLRRAADTLWDKMKAIATKIYGASDITADSKVRGQIKKLQESGYGHYPICVAKTQYSFSTDPQLRGAPSGPRGERARGAARRRGGIRRDDLRRHHDDARPAEGALGVRHRRDRRRQDHRAFLEASRHSRPRRRHSRAGSGGNPPRRPRLPRRKRSGAGCMGTAFSLSGIICATAAPGKRERNATPGKVAIVTGAGSGFGEAIARRYAGEGRGGRW